MIKSTIFNENLYFIKQEIKENTTVNVVSVPQKINHVICLDCSGSMGYDLPLIRKQLKNKLSNLVKENDTVSIIWFSSKNQAGILKEEVEVKSLTDLTDLHNSIDKFIKPISLTGFVSPLQLVKEVIERISSNPIRKGSQYSMLFLTDGYDNQSSEGDILKATKELEQLLSSATFVEYGYYANRKLLGKMSETLGASHIFSEDFQSYDPIFESIISKNIISTKKINVKLEYNVKNGFVFSLNKEDNSIVTYKTDENNEVLVGDDVTELFYLTLQNSSSQVSKFDYAGDSTNSRYLKPFYTMLYLLSQRGLSSDIYSMLAVMGDVYVVQQFINAFGKKDTSKFQQLLLSTISGDVEPYLKGFNNKIIPDENVYCILNLLEDLMSDEDNLWYSGHPSFKYNKIGSNKVQASSVLLDSEIETIKNLTSELTKTSDLSKIKELQVEIAKITSEKFELKFEYADKEKGSPIQNLTYNENRANISILVKSFGKVKLPENEFNLTEVSTFRYNNYTIVRDGVINFDNLPVSLSLETFNKLKKEGVINDYEHYIKNFIYIIDLKQIPIINRGIVKTTEAKQLFTIEYQLLKLKAQQKVYNHYEKEHFPKISKSFVDEYGIEASNWLKEIGITDFNGFSPKVTNDQKIGDFYYSVELNVNIKGISSLPSVNDVLKKLEAKKTLTPREELLAGAINDYRQFITSSIYLENENKEDLLETWLKNKKKNVVSKTRELINKVSKIKFGIILGQVWFSDFESTEDTKMKLTLDDKEIDFEVLLEDKEVEI